MTARDQAQDAKKKRLGRGLASLMSNTRQVEEEPETQAPSTASSDQKGSNAGQSASDAAVQTDDGQRHSRPAVAASPVAARGQDSPDPSERGEPHSHDTGVYLGRQTEAQGTAALAGAKMLDIEQIRPNPHQPRRDFDEEHLTELTESIRAQGILQPLLVTEGKGGYTLVAGERRLRAARLAGLRQLPCIVREATREQMAQWALIENVQRTDLNPIEKAQAYRAYLDSFMATQQQLAAKLGQPRSTIANHLRLLDLCDTAQSAVVDGGLSLGHAKVLAALVGREEQQVRLTHKVVENGLSVRQLEQLVAARVNDPAGERPAESAAPTGPSDDYVTDLEKQLSMAVGARVKVKPSRRRGSGKIVLNYGSLDEFDHLVERLGVRLES